MAWTDVKLQACNENGSGTTFLDQSSVGRPVNRSGDAVWTTANPPTGLSSTVALDGTGDFLFCSATADFQVGTGDFTVEGYFRFGSTANSFFFGPYTSFGNGWGLFREAGSLKMRMSNAVQHDFGAMGVATATWYHIAACRASGTLRAFLNGAQVGTDKADATTANPTINFCIGAFADGSFAFNGRVASVRYEKGVALYTGAFTPPALPLAVLPEANFSGVPLSGTVPLTVVFTDQSTNSPTSWLWDFGDGQTSTSQNPSHVYSVAGTYSVSLTATNDAGSDGLTRSDYITAQAAVEQETGGGGWPINFDDSNRYRGWSRERDEEESRKAQISRFVARAMGRAEEEAPLPEVVADAVKETVGDDFNVERSEVDWAALGERAQRLQAQFDAWRANMEKMARDEDDRDAEMLLL